MPNWTLLKGRTMATWNTWKTYGHSNNQSDLATWDDYDNRMRRYDWGWRSYNNSTYDDINAYVRAYKINHALYEYIEDVYNPTNYIVNFAKTYTWGGNLDMLAGDGNIIKSSIPIETDFENLRPIIAEIWKWSQWQHNKGITTLYGAAMGDYGLKVVDDVENGRVYLKVVHPATMTDIIKDEFGSVKAYKLDEQVPDPRSNKDNEVTYTETCEHTDGDNILFSTYLDGKPFDWNPDSDNGSQWENPYGFVPLVAGQHINIGQNYGQSAAYPARSKIRVIDNLATQLAAHTGRKTKEIYFQTGAKKADLTIEKATPTADNPQPNKTAIAVLYGGKEGKIQSLTSDIDVSGNIEEIQELLKGLAREYPEMKLDDAAEVVGAKSGAALRVLQDPATNKMQDVRTSYDPVLVNAHQMAMTIGALGGYDAYAGLDPAGFAKGDFEHTVGVRDVFKPDKTEQLIQENLFWDAVNKAVDAATKATSGGVSLEAILLQQGLSEDEVSAIMTKQRRTATTVVRQNARARINGEDSEEEDNTDE